MDQGIFAPIFYAMIGSWGRAVIRWALDNPYLVGGFMSLWMVLFFAGNWQLNRLKERTNKLVIHEANRLLGEVPGITVKQFYKKLKPSWEEMVKHNAWFVPHRWELWPMPATPSIVEQRIDFTAEWLGEFLWMEEVKMHGAKPRENPPEDDPLTKLKKMGRNQ
ncbi:MAG: hypothetical protein PVH60_09830 [Anaerolineales bacterium]|jgi:hypothetical protein